MNGEELVRRARAGDRAAFDELVRPHVASLRGVIRRMVGHPEDTSDLVQDTLERALARLESFRGSAEFATWLHAIGIRLAIDHLRERRRWRWDAQEHVRHYLHETVERDHGVEAAFSTPGFVFDVREHVAFCFTCVARSLEPEEQAALVLRDVLGYSNQEAADMLGLSEPVLRHRLAAARGGMQQRFEGLCAIVNQRGVCYQCAGLRERNGNRGPAVPDLGGQPSDDSYRARLRVVRDSNVDDGRSQVFHDLVWRALETLEASLST
jgi:RNA polymerase sigma-70 factor (ECF subfamily)